MQHHFGHHHLHRRKRIHLRHEMFPPMSKQKKIVDKLAFGIGLFGPIMTLPQIYEIYAFQDAGSVSTISWVAYLFTALFWLYYGIIHKEWPIITTNGVWVLLDVVIIVGTIIY